MLQRPRMGSPAAASSSSSALVAASTSTPTRSTLQQQILSEEAYTSTLSGLIRRDFFPHLHRLEAENAYLDALTHADEPGGQEKLERAVRRLVGHEVRAGIVPPTPRRGESVRSGQREETPGMTPSDVYFDDTPRADVVGRGEWDPTPVPRRIGDMDTSATGIGGEEGVEDGDQAPPLDGLTLSSFQTQYTSEDNASFLDILKANEAKRKAAFKWAYDAEKKANAKRQASLHASQLQAEAGFRMGLEKAPIDVKRRIEAGRQPKMITSNGEVGQIAVQEEDRVLPTVGVAEVSPATGEAKSLQSWSHHARNALFYGPDVDRSTHSQRTSSLPLSKKAVASAHGTTSIFGDEVSEDRAPGINFRNTRLHDDDDEEEGSKGSETPRSSRIDAAIGGWGDASSVAGRSSESSADVPPSSPRVAGYSFVSPLPSPRPGDLGEERVRQLMTWGTVIGTPRAVGQDPDEEYDGSFRIPPTPNRDLLARRLADKASGSRKRLSSTPKSSPRRKSRVELSPAGQTLLDRTSRGSTGLTSLGSSLLNSRQSRANRLQRERWTPTPSPRR